MPPGAAVHSARRAHCAGGARVPRRQRVRVVWRGLVPRTDVPPRARACPLPAARRRGRRGWRRAARVRADDGGRSDERQTFRGLLLLFFSFFRRSRPSVVLTALSLTTGTALYEAQMEAKETVVAAVQPSSAAATTGTPRPARFQTCCVQRTTLWLLVAGALRPHVTHVRPPEKRQRDEEEEVRQRPRGSWRTPF